MAEVTENLKVALQNTGLPQEQIDAWKISKAQATNTTLEEFENIIDRKEVHPKPTTMSQEGYINYLLSSIVTAIPSGEIVEITPKGRFPSKTMKGTVTSEMPCKANIGNNTIDVLMIAKGEKNAGKLSALDLDKTYQTRISLVQKNGTKAWIGDDTTFTEMENSTHHEVQCPVVNLIDVESNLSRFEPNSTFVYRTDIRKVPGALIMEENIGDNWARLGIVDGTWIPTLEQRHFTAWADPIDLRKVGAGEGSFIDIYGTLERDDKGRTYMNVCRIQPILKRPLREIAPVNGDKIRVLNINM